MQRNYLRLPARLWPLFLVLTCGLMLGYFLLRTFVFPLPHQYQLDFGSAQWIEPPQFSPVAYFRQKIFLSAAPELAWLEIAATDSYQLTVNGHKIREESFLNTRVAGIYDIKAFLVPGTNVIAVEVDRNSYPASAQLLVNGAVKQPGQQKIPIISGPDWRVTTSTGIVQGTEPWDSVLVQDALWPNARPVTPGDPVSINWVSTNPLLVQLPITGKWLLARNAPREAIFSTSMQASQAHQETWLQVASSGDLDLLVNGTLITVTPAAGLNPKPPKLVRSAISPTTTEEQQPPSDVSTANATSLEPLSFAAYDLTRWIKAGPNHIIAAVRGGQQPAMLIADGFSAQKDGTLQHLHTDAAWQILGLTTGNVKPEPQRPVEAGFNGSAPWGYLKQGTIREAGSTDLGTLLHGIAVIAGVTIAVLLAWLVISRAAVVLTDRPIQTTLIRDAILHVPITILLILLVLLSYDYRFPNDWAFQPRFCLVAFVALAAIRLLHLVPSSVADRISSPVSRLRATDFRKLLPYLLLAGIVIFGGYLRYRDLGWMSFDHDEMGVIQKSRGVFVRGYPYTEYYGNVIRPATTYELVPYFLATMGKLFGYSEWSMRLPSCIWGTLTIGLIGLMGRRLFNWRTGLVTAFIYACMPVNVRWAQNAFYVQQCQFFGVLTFWSFYEAIRVRPLRHGYLTACTIFFCLTFLSWEGSGFVLPALIVGLVVVRWGQWWWLKDWYLYKCLFYIAALVVAQSCWRSLCGTPPFLSVGSGLSNVAGPSLFFLNFAYRSTFYINKLLLDENHVFFTLSSLAGLLFYWRHAGFRYTIAALGTVLFLYTNFLAAVSQRYPYLCQPLLLLSGVAAAIALSDRLIAMARSAGSSLAIAAVARLAGFAIVFLLYIQSNSWLIKPYTLAAEGNAPGLMSRPNTYRYDYRSAAQYVKSHFQPGDVIIPVVSHVFEFYAGTKGDYYLNSLLSKKVTYSDQLAEPVFIEKFRGNPTIRDLTELREVVTRSRRTWLVIVPSSSLTKLNGRDVLEYLGQNAKTVFESYRAKVFLIQGANSPDNVAQSAQ